MIDANTILAQLPVDDSGQGQFSGLLCPQCDGGSSRERTFSVHITGNEIKYHCHRASCNASGVVSFRGGRMVAPSDISPLIRAPRPFTGQIYPLSEADIAYFTDQRSLSPRWAVDIARTYDSYIMHIHRPFQAGPRGHVVRRPWAGSPLAEHYVDRGMPKSMTYTLRADEQMVSWYATAWESKHHFVILVEDQLSALRLMSYFDTYDRDAEVAVCALLGTGLNQERIAEIQRVASVHATVVIALDNDATGQAFAHARKWGHAFAHTRVMVLSKDIKDMTNREIEDLLE